MSAIDFIYTELGVHVDSSGHGAFHISEFVIKVIYVHFSAKTLLIVEEFTIPSDLLSQNKGGKWK